MVGSNDAGVLLGNVVRNLVEGVADGQFGGDLGDGKAGRFRREAPTNAKRAGSSR